MKYTYGSLNKDKKFIKSLMIISAAIIILGAFTWAAINRWNNLNLGPPSGPVVEAVVSVEPGESIESIAKELQDSGLIRSASAFKWYLVRNNLDDKLQAGTYSLNSMLSADEIAQIIISGQVDRTFITIIPGLRLDEIEEVLINNGFSKEEVLDALYSEYDHPLLNYKPKDASLEGYIYPDTYSITDNDTARDVVMQAFDNFYNKLDDKLVSDIKKQNLTVHQGIILASIIQEESSDPDIQKTIAQVFLKRLKLGMPLGADPTFRYAAAITGQTPSPDIDSPYNTRKYAGLPPGPIANFYISALDAVAHPTPTDYLYFVAGDDGETYFSKTLSEHQRYVEQHCLNNCKVIID